MMHFAPKKSNVLLLPEGNTMKTQKRKDFRTSVILSEQQYNQLQELAEANDSSIARLIRQALTFFLESQQKSISVAANKKKIKHMKKG